MAKATAKEVEEANTTATVDMEVENSESPQNAGSEPNGIDPATNGESNLKREREEDASTEDEDGVNKKPKLEKSVEEERLEKLEDGVLEEKVKSEEGVEEEKVKSEEGVKKEKVKSEEGVKEEKVKSEGIELKKVKSEEGVEQEKVKSEEGVEQEKVKLEGVKQEKVKSEGVELKKVKSEEGVELKKVKSEEGVEQEKVKSEGVKLEKVKSEERVEEEEKSGPVNLGYKTFGSSVEIFDYFYKFLHQWPLYLNINKYEQTMLLELLKKGHSEPDKKIGAGIRTFQIRNHPTFKSKCFFLIREDDSVDDFSFRKCVDNILPLPEDMQLKSHVNKMLGRGGRGGGGRGGGRGHGRGGKFRR